MKSQRFSWDRTNELFYYINEIKLGYVVISKAEQPEVYEFLMGVYGVNYQHVKDKLGRYTEFESMSELSNY